MDTQINMSYCWSLYLVEGDINKIISKKNLNEKAMKHNHNQQT